ncbi:flagellar basal-body rod protein FlgB [Evansella vedderi]|uniref:Flagellar basal body rod protein FlgB n=1 Tax=Evansella vedderi TaxID=38282 RepID=A0ABT9ZS66_9BACI|nr:flagellar basal body rod protein FlgB [Evansella vedderi]MDQ0253719.1 flagellar basal-body rod protein FlgB [Evansella vedderi]
MDLLNNSTNTLIQSALSASTMRQNTISENIANVDTPNYKAKKTIFNHELHKAINNSLSAKRTDNRHVEFGGQGLNGMPAQIIKRSNTQMNHNGNNVDIDLEMAELAKNQIYYNALIDRLNGRYNSIRTVLGQGR